MADAEPGRTVIRLRAGATTAGAVCCVLLAAGGLVAWAASGGWHGLVVAAVGAAGAGWCGFRLVARPAGLVLDEEGLLIAVGSRWRRLGAIRWEDIARAEFTRGPYPRIVVLALTLREPETYLGGLDEAERAKLAPFAPDAHLSVVVNGLDISPSELAALVRPRLAGQSSA